MLIDVHCHLDAKEFEKDADAVIERAEAAQLSVMISNGLNPESNRKILELCKKHKTVKAALGFYPDDVLQQGIKAVKKEIAFIRKTAKEHPKTVLAIGEVGIDLAYGKTEKDLPIMEEALALFVKLSNQLGKPLIVHTRRAELQTIELLEEEKAKKVIFHCFGGKLSLAERIIKNGWFLTIPANINRSEQFQSFVKQFPLSQLLTETDAPFLSPDGQGVRNEPANVKRTIELIAKLKGLTVEETANQIYMNYQKLF
jgi:TatD DNase family protein